MLDIFSFTVSMLRVCARLDTADGFRVHPARPHPLRSGLASCPEADFVPETDSSGLQWAYKGQRWPRVTDVTPTPDVTVHQTGNTSES